MSDDKKGFTIKDRRHFTAEGQAREGASVDVSPVGPGTAPDVSTPEAQGASVGHAAEVDFPSFLLSLGAQAGELLAGARSSEGGGGQALAAARQIISVLEMLNDKTEGRRTPDESRLLDGLLYELRLAYVEATSGVKA